MLAEALEDFLGEVSDGFGTRREAGVASVDRAFEVRAAAACPAAGGVHAGVGGVGEDAGGDTENVLGGLDQGRVGAEDGDMAEGAGGGVIGGAGRGAGGFDLGEEVEDSCVRVRRAGGGNRSGGPQSQGDGPGGPQRQDGGGGLACLDQVEAAVVAGGEQVDVTPDTGEGVEEPDPAESGAQVVGEAREFGILGRCVLGFAAEQGDPVRHQAALVGGPAAERGTPVGLADVGEEHPHPGQRQGNPLSQAGPAQACDACPARPVGEGVDPPVQLGGRDPHHHFVTAGGEAADAERAAGEGGAVTAVGGDQRVKDPCLAPGLVGRGRRDEVREVRVLGSGRPFGFARGHLAQGGRGDGRVGRAKALL
ncbi:hypothetical protein [Streptomyces sp. NPDC001933]|uniref:hypothetical protein n=1 Tax=Streptomyces sp. NPDC001933 TaxID=3364626 RepID=UPI0036C2832C